MGYAESSIAGVTPMIGLVLDSFFREGLIKWREIVEMKMVNERMVPVTRRELLFVAESQN